LNTLELVKEFHEAFNHPVENKPCISEYAQLRIDLIQEELDELTDAIRVEDTEKILDALCDLQYVLDGAFLTLGFHRVKDKAFAEVHRSNMSKLGEDGKPIYREDGKILKGPNYSSPNLGVYCGR
jgi:predicted HAD superfamily Cof-like phosphohydrolase